MQNVRARNVISSLVIVNSYKIEYISTEWYSLSPAGRRLAKILDITLHAFISNLRRTLQNLSCDTVPLFQDRFPEDVQYEGE